MICPSLCGYSAVRASLKKRLCPGFIRLNHRIIVFFQNQGGHGARLIAMSYDNVELEPCELLDDVDYGL